MRKGFWTVAKQIIKKADIVLEVLDARMPELTRNKQMEKNAAKCRNFQISEMKWKMLPTL